MTKKEIICKNFSSRICMGNAWSLLPSLLPDKDIIIITDINVSGLYGENFPEYPVITIGTGEAVKEYDTVETIIKHLLAMGADRSSFLLGIGGGVVCDITGFVASIFMRGLEFGFISTTLLSQVDASTGGKNGVNVNGIKNIIGCFNHPLFVICDTAMLETLSDEDYISGMGELLKHALIRDRELFETMEENTGLLRSREPGLLEELVFRSVEIKSSVVEKDGREQGERRLLNFGHTLGHAIESVTGLSHGMSIAAGMMVAAEISHDEGMLEKADVERIRKLMKNLGLLPEINISRPDILDKIQADKKKEGRNIHFILLKAIGEGVQKVFPIDEITAVIRAKII
ncbi:MAG: 3-dehydroquinate synthase [Bacteroidales bacterium]